MQTQRTQTEQPTTHERFATFVALLVGRLRNRAGLDFEMDAPETMAAAALLKGDKSAASFFDPRRTDRALTYARDAGLLTT
jgi:hypothetical protein